MMTSNYRSFIETEFKRRQKRNLNYSLRAFARDLQLPPSRLSEILNGKVGVSHKRAIAISESLKLNSYEKEAFLGLVLSEHGRTEEIRIKARLKVSSLLLDAVHLKSEKLSLVSEWLNMAILSLLPETQGCSFIQITQSLKLPDQVIKYSLLELERAGLVSQENSQWKKINKDYTTVSEEQTSPEIRQFHENILHKAIESINSQSIQDRDLSAVMFCIDKTNLPEIKSRIKDFRRELMKEFELTEKSSDLYCMSIQFFMLSDAELN